MMIINALLDACEARAAGIDNEYLGVSIDAARAELAQLRAKAKRLDEIQDGMSEMRAAIESEYTLTIQQLTELSDRQFDDIAYLRAQAARVTALETAITQARAQLRSTALNWQEDCLFLCDEILTGALAANAPQETEAQHVE